METDMAIGICLGKPAGNGWNHQARSMGLEVRDGAAGEGARRCTDMLVWLVLLFDRLGRVDWFCIFCRLVFVGSFLGPLGQYIKERERILRRLDLAGQGRSEGDHSSVELTGRVLVLLDHRSRETDSRKRSASPRVGQDLRSQLPVRVGGGVASHGACGYGRIGTQLEFAGKKVFQSVLVHDQHDQVNCLAADLETHTPAAGENECGSTPTGGSPAARDSAAIARGHDESRL